MFDLKFGWTTKQAGVYQGMIGAAIVLGLMVGSFLNGTLIKRGRRFALFVGAVIGILACLSTIWRNFIVILIARFFFGLSAGIMSGVC